MARERQAANARPKLLTAITSLIIAIVLLRAVEGEHRPWRTLGRRTSWRRSSRLSGALRNIGEGIALIAIRIEDCSMRATSNEGVTTSAAVVGVATVLMWILIIAVGHEHAVEYVFIWRCWSWARRRSRRSTRQTGAIEDVVEYVALIELFVKVQAGRALEFVCDSRYALVVNMRTGVDWIHVRAVQFTNAVEGWFFGSAHSRSGPLGTRWYGFAGAGENVHPRVAQVAIGVVIQIGGAFLFEAFHIGADVIEFGALVLRVDVVAVFATQAVEINSWEDRRWTRSCLW